MLAQYERELASLGTEVLPRLEKSFKEFDKRYHDVQGAQSALRITAKQMRERLRYYRAKHQKLSMNVAHLIKELRYGKALLATNQDLQAFERAIKKRRTRLRVAKLRKKVKSYPNAVLDIPVPGELMAQ